MIIKINTNDIQANKINKDINDQGTHVFVQPGIGCFDRLGPIIVPVQFHSLCNEIIHGYVVNFLSLVLSIEYLISID